MKRRPPRRVEVEAAAKINLGWQVGPRRTDGYHEVTGLMQTISLCDRVQIEVWEGDAGVRVVVPGHPDLERPSNLVHAAATALTDDPLPTTITIHKSIPVAAGLGGGSADAAAALLGLSLAWGLRFSVGDLVGIAATIGSDVPGLLVGGLVAVSGRGEVVRRVGSFDDGWLVLGVGDEEVPTSAVYELFDEVGAEPSPALFHNDLEGAACELVPSLRGRIAVMRDAAGIAFVSGSGPTVVGVASDEPHARGVAATVRDHFADVVIAQPSTWGVRLGLHT